MPLSEPQHEAKIMPGVTTGLVGLDGMGYAPLPKTNLEMMKVCWAALNPLSSIQARNK